MNTPALTLVVIRSKDIEHAIQFYQALGLEFVAEAHGAGPKHYACARNGLVFEIYPLLAISPPTIGTRLGFQVHSVDAVVERLRQIGGKILKPPHDSPHGRHAIVEDMDLHRIELTSALESPVDTSR